MAIQKIPNTLIADNAVTAAKIANGSLTADDISNNSITAAKLSVSTSPTFASLTTTGVLNNFSTGSSWGTGLTLTNTNDDASPAILTFKKAPASGHTTMADNDYIGFINFRADNSNNDEHNWVELSVLALDVTDGSEDSAFRITTWGGGTEYTNTLIANGGNVGIGTANPNANFHVGSAAATGTSANPALQIGGANTYRLGLYTDSEGGIIQNLNGDDGLQFRVKTKGEAMRIDGGTGNVGIGTSNPQMGLHVGSGSQSVAALAGIGIANGGSSYSFYSASDGTKQYIAGIDHNITYTKAGSLSNHSHAIVSNNTVRLFCKNDGFLGIGDVDPDSTVHIKNSTAGGPQIHMDDGTNSGFINFDGQSMQISTQRDMVDGTWHNTSRSWGGINIVGHSTGSYITFQTAPSNNTSPSERLRIQANGGISFNGDTAAANALDDYEEGTWTPACGATLATAVGKYTKIGNQVTVYYHFVTTGGLPSSTSQVIITGLPFTSNSGSLVAAPIYSRYYTPNDSSLTSLVQDSETQIRLMNINDQNFDYTIWGELEASGNNSVYIIGSATYMV